MDRSCRRSARARLRPYACARASCWPAHAQNDYDQGEPVGFGWLGGADVFVGPPVGPGGLDATGGTAGPVDGGPLGTWTGGVETPPPGAATLGLGVILVDAVGPVRWAWGVLLTWSSPTSGRGLCTAGTAVRGEGVGWAVAVGAGATVRYTIGTVQRAVMTTIMVVSATNSTNASRAGWASSSSHDQRAQPVAWLERCRIGLAVVLGARTPAWADATRALFSTLVASTTPTSITVTAS